MRKMEYLEGTTIEERGESTVLEILHVSHIDMWDVYRIHVSASGGDEWFGDFIIDFTHRNTLDGERWEADWSSAKPQGGVYYEDDFVPWWMVEMVAEHLTANNYGNFRAINTGEDDR